MPFRALLDIAPQGDGRPAVALTFDDGYADNHEYVLPVLRKYGNPPATVFLTAGLIDRDPQVCERFRVLRGTPVEALEWPQVRELLAAGVEIGAHTYSHPNLIRLDQAAANHELRRSKELIEDRIGIAVDLFAYPFGKPNRHFNARTMEAVRDTGYRYGAAILYRGVQS